MPYRGAQDPLRNGCLRASPSAVRAAARRALSKSPARTPRARVRRDELPKGVVFSDNMAEGRYFHLSFATALHCEKQKLYALLLCGINPARPQGPGVASPISTIIYSGAHSTRPTPVQHSSRVVTETLVFQFLLRKPAPESGTGFRRGRTGRGVRLPPECFPRFPFRKGRAGPGAFIGRRRLGQAPGDEGPVHDGVGGEEQRGAGAGAKGGVARASDGLDSAVVRRAERWNASTIETR